MSSTLSRRTLAKGTLWSVPVIAVAAAAPAMAASPCGVYKAGQPLPASAFTLTYLNVTNETLGGAANKQVALEFGFRLSDEARSCGVTSGSISSSNNGGTSSVVLANGVSYSMTNGGSVPANGNVGTVDTTCRTGTGGTEACGTSGQSAYNVLGSTGTSGSAVQRIAVYRSITVSGYGTTVVYFNATIPTTGGFPHNGTNLSVSANSPI